MEEDDNQHAQGWGWLEEALTLYERDLEAEKLKESALAKASVATSAVKKQKPVAETPRSSKLVSKGTFSSHEEPKIKGTIYYPKEMTRYECAGCGNEKLEIRDPLPNETSSDIREEGFNEVMIIVGNLPQSVRHYVLRRRAASLPRFCDVCKRWSAPMYRCFKCNTLMYGIYIGRHEDKCTGNNVSIG